MKEVCSNQPTNEYYDKKYIFSFVFSNIIDYLVNRTHKLTSKQKMLFEKNMPHFNEECMSIVSQTMIFHLNNMYKKQKNFKRFNDFFERFINDFNSDTTFRISFFNTYPELFKILYAFFDNQITCFLNILNIVESKEKEFKDNFDINIKYLTDINMSMGDRHSEGKATSLIIIGEKEFFMKWKENDFESHFLDIYKYITNKVTGNRIDTKINSIEGPNYYIQESIHQNESNDSKKLYYNNGIFLFVSYLLGMTDLHEENIIITDNNVVAIDCETIFNYADVNYDFIDNYNLGESVYSTALLPHNSVAGAVLSGFNSNKNQYLYVDNFKIKVYDQEIIMINLNKVSLSEKKNKPLSLIQTTYYENKDLIKEGFRDSYIKYLESKYEIIIYIKQKLDNLIRRVLYKNTYEYNLMLWRSYHPHLMMYPKKRYEFFESLDILEALEVDRLYKNSIPLFEEKLNIPLTFFNKFSYKDLDIQLKLINEAFDLDKRRNSKNSMEDNNLDIKTFINNYKNYLIERTLNVDDTYVWLDIVETGNKEYKNLELSIMPKTLYYGTSGIYLYLIEYYKKYPNKNEEIVMENQIKNIFHEIKHEIKEYPEIQNGFYDGMAGVLYLVYMSNKTYDICKPNQIINLLEILVENINNDISFDVIAGSSGLLALLHFIYDDLDDNKAKLTLISLIELTTNYLIINYKNHNNKCGWASYQENSDIIYFGYAHGIAGIIPQLYKSYSLTKDIRIRKVVDECVEFLLNTYNEEKSTWASNNSKDDYYYSWCHGTPGVIQSLAMLYNYGYRSINMEKMIEVNLNVIIEQTKDSVCLCHGSYGNYSIGAYCAKVIGDKNMYNTFKKLISEELKKLCDSSNLEFYNKSFMTGLSGVMYWVLKDNEYNPIC